VAVPTGWNKEYAVVYMMAALKNIDYPHNRLTVNVAVTNRGDKQSEPYRVQVQNLLRDCKLGCSTSFHYVEPSKDEMKRWGPYFAIVSNLHRLRLHFLEGDCDYFWLLGGDNPPPRHMLRKLLELDVDVASPSIRQRPARTVEQKAIPMFWTYYWTMKDLEGWHPRLKEALRKAWPEIAFLRFPDPNKKRVHKFAAFGSGCSLVKRVVLEHCGYVLGTGGYHSEDLHFSQYANFYEFTTAVNMNLYCPHMDADGFGFA
jgi:hypothetical protein